MQQRHRSGANSPAMPACASTQVGSSSSAASPKAARGAPIPADIDSAAGKPVLAGSLFIALAGGVALWALGALLIRWIAEVAS